jgi:cation transport ATPase
VRLNIGFTAAYNLAGITLAALGFLPPILAAALQSIPDLGIMGNSARLLPPRRASDRSEPGRAVSGNVGEPVPNP